MYRIGIDLGGTNIAGGIVNEAHEIIVKKSIPTNAASADGVADGIAELVRELCSAVGISPTEADSVGIGAPGIVDAEEGVVDYVCNLPLRYYPLSEAVASRLGLKKEKIRLENDANAAALGEMVAGAGIGTRDFMMLTLGTGVGGGVIHNRKILTSHNHAGGELGHAVIAVDGVPCGCGRRGCCEAYCSATALVRMANEAVAEAAAKGHKTLLADLPKLDGKAVYDALAAGDAVAREVTEKYHYYVAVMIANYINIFQPEAIAVGGGISGAGEALLMPLQKLIYPDMIYNRDQPESMYTKLVLATLGGDAGIIGAAALGGDSSSANES